MVERRAVKMQLSWEITIEKQGENGGAPQVGGIPCQVLREILKKGVETILSEEYSKNFWGSALRPNVSVEGDDIVHSLW